MKALIAAIAATAVGAVVLASSGAAESTPRLFGTVDQVGRVTLKDAEGRNVTAVTEGHYIFVVRDRSRRHNFHFRGFGALGERRTGYGFTGNVRWLVPLPAGSFRYGSDRRPRGMRVLRVT
jgi:hypothetical protein